MGPVVLPLESLPDSRPVGGSSVPIESVVALESVCDEVTPEDEPTAVVVVLVVPGRGPDSEPEPGLEDAVVSSVPPSVF